MNLHYRPTMKRPASHRGSAKAGRGAASLVVVMVLFFIITLVAAYASRNLLFEQRTSANQYRSTLAFETAEAGVEWALARLNDARMNDNCTPLTSPAAVGTQESFRQRYLNIDAATGVVAPIANRIAGCVFNGTNWVCDCSVTATPNPTVTYSGNGPFAAFWVQFQQVTPVAPGVTGVVRMQVNSCTRVDAACLNFTRQAQPGDGLATVWAMVALRNGVATLPAAALTATGAVDRNGSSDPRVTNVDQVSGGFTIRSGSTIATNITGPSNILTTIPGTPTQFSVAAGDAALVFPALALVPTANPANLPANRSFNATFGMWPTTYFAQPGLVNMACPGNCDAGDVNDQVRLNPGHVIRIGNGGTNARLRINANIGTAAAPVVIVADPEITVEFGSGNPTVRGLIYSRAANWRLQGDGTILGAAVAEGSFEFRDDDPVITYDRAMLQGARFTNGTFVKVPGGWRDFQP